MPVVNIVRNTAAGTASFRPSQLELKLGPGQRISVVFRNLDKVAAHRVLESFDGGPPVLKFVLMEVRGDVTHSANLLFRGAAEQHVAAYSCASHPDAVCTITVVPNV